MLEKHLETDIPLGVGVRGSLSGPIFKTSHSKMPEDFLFAKAKDYFS